jgi:quinol monooxygenase YgiN
MDDFVAYLDTSEVRPGKLEELKTAMAELATFVEQNEPRIISYSVFFSQDGSTMSVLHFHPDMASLEFHMKVAGPKFPPVAPLIRMKTIEIFGRPSDDLLAQLQEKARLLGSGSVIVRDIHAGFARFTRDQPPFR